MLAYPRSRSVWATCVGIAAIFAGPLAARAERLEIWVAPGLYGIAESNCNTDAITDPTLVLTNIDERLCGVFNETGRKELAEHFAREMTARFGEAIVARPGENLPSSTSIGQRLRNTLSASLHVSRADVWEVEKSTGSTEVHLPNTVSLLLTNVSTGEAVFTQTRSLIPVGVTFTTNVAPYANEQMPEQIRANISELVREAAERFRPYPVRATIQGAFDDRYVIDKGRLAGVRQGDRFQGDIKVLFADADYAVIQPQFGEKLKAGDVLEMQNVQPAEYLSKHSAMVIVGSTPAAMSPAYIKQTFEEKLGATTIFNTVPVNPSLPLIRTMAATAAGSPVNNEDRVPPEYFVYVQSFLTDYTEIPTNIPSVTLKTYEAYSVGEITDRSGRVLYSRVASDRIVDEVPAGIGFPNDQRQDTAVRNSLEKLARFIEAEFKPSSLRLPIEKVGGESFVIDQGGMLAPGTNGMVLRKVGQFGAVKGPVWSPVANLMKVEHREGRTALKGDGLSGPVERGDVFAVDGSGEQPAQTRRAFSLCAKPLNLPPNDLSALPLFRAIGRTAFTQVARVPVYIDELAPLARNQLATFRISDVLGIVQPRTSDICIKPIFRFTPQAPASAKGDYKSERHAMSIGYTLHDAEGARLSGNGVQAELSTSPLPLQTSDQEVGKSVLREFVFQMNKLAPTTVSKLVIP